MKNASRFKLRRVCQLVLCAALLPLAAHAEVDALVREALALAEAGQGRAAYDLLEPQEVKRAGDPDFDTVFGIAANQVGEHARAVMALERVMLVQPRNGRARAELGRAMFGVGDARSARTLLAQAKQDGAPAEVAATIDTFLRAIERAEADGQSGWRGYVEGTVGSDSNVSAGPANGNVAVPQFGGQVIALNPNAVKQDATLFGLGAGINGRYVIDSRLSLIGGANANLRHHPGDSVFNNYQLAVNGGVAYRSNKDEFTAVLTHDDYSQNGNSLRVQDGLIAEWTNRRAQTSQYGAYLQYSRLHYPGASVRDVNRTVVGGSYAQQLGDKAVGFAGIYLGREQATTAGNDFQGHKLTGFRLGGQMDVAADWTGFAGLTYEHRGYNGVNPLFNVVRNDNQSTLSLGANWNGLKDWRISPQISYTRVKSNIVINDYERTQIFVTARRAF